MATCPTRALYYGTESEVKELVQEKEALRLGSRSEVDTVLGDYR